ncbi:sensor histidine kinase [Desulfomonile tiedjei]|uniref:histidine kinase n=1 Tax=Desulfomonile tiedjei (strain ATCC 49306 / DSM 6799 / DCB-1) TaxID=706587 RepID=I4C4A3_DESTA|nr:PAS domain S-box protein [Desulfomonile tiedjei]AFM24394.1 PAS domain S-box [Desulfomonile tiedjei DSM 6799]
MSSDPSQDSRFVPDPIEKIILKSMNEGVITLECTGKIHTTNPAALKILGFEQEDLVGRQFYEVFSDPRNSEFADTFMHAVQSGKRQLHPDVEYTRADGQVVYLSLAPSFLDYDVCVPDLQNVVVVFRDVTALKSLEQMKRRAVNHLSHELRTPLAIITASVGTLAADERSTEKQQKAFARVERNIKRLAELSGIIEEIFNPPVIDPQTIQVRSTIEEILAELRLHFLHRSVTIGTCIGSDLQVVLDRSLLVTVIKTLVKNSVEAVPNGGEILVTAERVTGGMSLTVQDWGVGIAIGDREFIFDGFHNTQITDDYSSKRPYDFNAGGKGLELLRLKTLAEASLFQISFSSARCRYIPEDGDHCPGDISLCSHISGIRDCKASGGTTFGVLFPSISSQG